MIDHDMVRYGMVAVGLLGLAYLHKNRILAVLSTMLFVDRKPATQSTSPRTAYATPTPTTWISHADASATIARSSLVRLRVTSDTTLLDTLARRLGDTYKTPGEVRAAELQRKLLRDFAAKHPSGVRDEQYGKELLEWWIDEQSYHEST